MPIIEGNPLESSKNIIFLPLETFYHRSISFDLQNPYD
jgi:hypothetical protein